jgi:hypothetical protein
MDRLVFHASVPFESYISRADIAICGERFACQPWWVHAVIRV